jgi:RhoGAP domain
MLRHFLEAMPEPMLEPTLFHAFYQSCYLPTRAMADSKTGTAEATGTNTNRTSDELSRIAIAKLLFRLMPEAHSSALTYLLAFFALIPTVQNKRTYKELAKAFGPSICSPRDPLQHFIALGALPDNSGTGLNKENAEKWVRQMGSQLLLWLLCYWDEISSWRDFDPTFDIKEDADATAWFQESQTSSKRVYASPEAAEHSHLSSDSVPSEYSQYPPLESVVPLKLGVSGKEAVSGHDVHDPYTAPTTPTEQSTPDVDLERLDQSSHSPDFDQRHSHEQAGSGSSNPIDGGIVARLESLIVSQSALLRTKDDMITLLETRISALEKTFLDAEMSGLTERLNRVEEESSGTAKKLQLLRNAL